MTRLTRGLPPLVSLILLCSLLGTGCYRIDTTKELSPFNTPFTWLLPPGSPLLTNLGLPSIDVCDRLSMDAVMAQIRALPLGALLAGVFQSLVHIEEVSIQKSVMEVLQPENGTFDGLTNLSVSLNGQTILGATDAAGIDGKTITLTTDAPVNLSGVIEGCPEVPAEIQIEAQGQVPSVPPTLWKNTVTIHIKARLGLF